MDVFFVMDQRWEECSTVLGRWAIVIDGVKFVTSPRGSGIGGTCSSGD